MRGSVARVQLVSLIVLLSSRAYFVDWLASAGVMRLSSFSVLYDI